MRTSKLYDSTRHPTPAANIAVVDHITVVVHKISPREVMFEINPEIRGFRNEARTQEIEFAKTDDAILHTLTRTSNPVEVFAGGKKYEVSLGELDSESTPGVSDWLHYCILDITQRSDSTWMA
jgi:hypothetical protein